MPLKYTNEKTLKYLFFLTGVFVSSIVLSKMLGFTCEEF